MRENKKMNCCGENTKFALFPPNGKLPGCVSVADGQVLCRLHGKLLCRVNEKGLELWCKYGHSLLLPWEALLQLCPEEIYASHRPPV